MKDHTENPRPLRVISEIPQRVEAETVTLADRRFAVLTHPTIEGERHWFWALKRGGLEALPRRPLESPEDFRARVRTHLIDSGMGYRLMAIRLVPVGEVWNPDSAGVALVRRGDSTAALLENPENATDIAVQLRVFELVLDDLMQRYEQLGVAP